MGPKGTREGSALALPPPALLIHQVYFPLGSCVFPGPQKKTGQEPTAHGVPINSCRTCQHARPPLQIEAQRTDIRPRHRVGHYWSNLTAAVYLPIKWTWTRAHSENWWRTGRRPGVLQSWDHKKSDTTWRLNNNIFSPHPAMEPDHLLK